MYKLTVKSFLLIVAMLAFIFITTSCSSEPAAAGSSAGSYASSDGKFEAEVTKDQIEIFLTNDGTKGLYWSGTWSEGETVVSDANANKLESSLLGSQHKSKEFVVDGDSITFEFSIMDTTSDVVLEKK